MERKQEPKKEKAIICKIYNLKKKKKEYPEYIKNSNKLTEQIINIYIIFNIYI